jgi:hypothetical protein
MVMAGNGGNPNAYAGITESYPIVLSYNGTYAVVANQWIGDAAGSPVAIWAQMFALGT